ncbi:cytochrome P450 [Tricladium varicosporioides]|nr:cytochrome P450 [Hymenoscyphus varicosporioides]
MATLTIQLLAVLVLLIVVYGIWQRKQKTLPPGVRRLPGPKGLPFIGRVHDVPSEATWLKFWEWSKEYGPIYQMEIFGTVHVWIASEQIANDLMAKRGSIYSDRPTIPNLPDNRTSGDYLPLLGRNDTWKRQRKFAHHIMSRSQDASQHSYPTIEREKLLYELLKDPTNYVFLLEAYTGRTISRLAWGDVEQAPQLKIDAAGLLAAISPSGAVPNVVSWLAYLPRFLSPWKQTEKARHDMENTFFLEALESVKKKSAGEDINPSYAKMFLEGKEKGDWQDEEWAYLIGMMAIAGALTIASPLQTYILAACHFPEWQTKMQEEIENVCGGRCPVWEDRENLPTVRAVVKEILRWRPPVPTGIPHRLESDDIYGEYFIPGGATIHALEWGICRDPVKYPDPEAFRPERWLDKSYPSYREPLTKYPNLQNYHQFGYGRRTCQGVEIVDQELFLVMAGLAWAFDIRKKKDPAGNEMVPDDLKYTSLLIAKPVKFDFDLTVRSEERRVAIEKAGRELEELETRHKVH